MLDLMGVEETLLPTTICAHCGRSFLVGDRVVLTVSDVFSEVDAMLLLAVHDICELSDEGRS